MTASLLAITEATSIVFFISLLVCLGLIAHALIARTPKVGDRVMPSQRALFGRLFLESLSIFVWLAITLPLLGWAFWYGDNDHWFMRRAWIFGLLIAIGTSAISAVRINRYGTSQRYLRLHFWLPVSLILLLGFVFVHESLQGIDGMTAEAASQEILEQFAARVNQPVRLVEHHGPIPRVGALEFHEIPPEGKLYWVIGQEEPLGRFSIQPHNWLGWTVTHNERFQPSVEVLARAKVLFGVPSDRKYGVSMLREVIGNYPDSPAAAEAAKLLESIRESP